MSSRRRLPPWVLVSVAALSLVGCRRALTPPGTVLAEVPEITSLPIGGGNIGSATGAWNATARTYEFRGPYIGNHPAIFRVAFEAAPATVTDPSKSDGPQPITTMRALKLTVVESQWFMTARCSVMPPSGDLPSVAVRVGCAVAIVANARSEPIDSWLEISATGAITATRGMEWDVVPK